VLEYALVEVGTGAGLHCAQCGPASAASYFPADEIIARIKSIAGAWVVPPGPNVILGGPEPFAHPELPALVAACVEAGVERVALATDGGALSLPANARGVLQAGVRHLRIRLLDADRGRGDRLNGIPGRTRDALAGIAAYLAAAEESGVPVVVTVVVPVCRHNVEALPATVAALARTGAHAVRLTAGASPVDSASAVLAAACDTGMVNQLWVEAAPELSLPETHALHVVTEVVRRG
jgi:MoaA/NifB/PqqE/SkfB family radical SAM enzyme